MASARTDHPAAISRTSTAEATATSHDSQPSVRRVSNRKSYPVEADTEPEFVDALHTLESQHFVSESDASSKKTLETPKLTKLAGQWWWEIGLTLLNIICTCLMLRVHYIVDGKPLADWRFGVSPGVLLFVLASIGKASISVPVTACISQLKWLYFTKPRPLQDLQRFDDASQSLWGAVKFFAWFCTKARANLALLGVIIYILTLPYELSTRQMLSYSSGNTSISDGSALAMRAWGWRSEGIAAGSGLHAITKGLFGQGDGEIFECTADACYFPAHTSLAMCSECRDISNAVDQCCDSVQSDSRLSGFDATDRICSWTPRDTVFRPVGIRLGTTWDHGNWLPNQQRLALSVQSTLGEGHFSSLAITVVNITTNSTREIGDTDSVLPGGVDVRACSWSLCSRTSAGVAIVNGRSNSSVKSAPLMLQGPFPAAGMIPEYSIYRRLSSDVLNKLSARGLALDPITNSNAEVNIDWLTMVTVWQDLSDLITGDQALNFLQSNNLSAAVDRISHELTKLILSNDNVWATEMQGQSFYAETYVHVRWPWLSLPVGLTLATLIFLTLTIILSFKSGSLILKSSNLPFLFFGLKDREGVKPDPPMVEDLKGLKEIAKRMKVKFATQEAQGEPGFTIVQELHSKSHK